MKKLLVSLVMLFCLCSVVKADDVLLELGNLDINIPLKVVKASELYDTKRGKGFTGLETTLVTNSKKNIEFVAGGATSTSDNENLVYLGLQTRLSESFFDISNNDFFFGGYAGRNFRRNENYAGLKASVMLW